MPLRVLNRFVSFIPKLEARERIENAYSASFPHLDRKSRDKLHKAWLEDAGFGYLEEQRVTWKELRDKLRGRPQPLEGVLDVATMTIKKGKEGEARSG